MSVARLYHDTLNEWLDIGLAAGAEGGALYTSGDAESTYRLVIGGPEMDAEMIAFAGIDGMLRADHGLRGRTIVISGDMRLSQAGWLSIMDQRDAFIAEGGTMTFTDDDDYEYSDCVFERFDLTERRRISNSSMLIWYVPYMIVLRQLVA